MTAASGAAPERDLTPDETWGLVPTAEEIFDKPYPPPGPIPLAWDSEYSIAAEIADRECARLIANALFDPPILEEEIEAHAREFGITRRQAELELRRSRDDDV